MKTLTKTVEAYTLEELKDLDDRGRAYDKALEAVKVWANDDGGDHCTWITECLNMILDQEEPVADVSMDGWDYDRNNAEITGYIHVGEFMAANKLNGKYRAFAYGIKTWREEVFDTYFSFDTDKQHDFDDLFVDEFLPDLERYTDLKEDDRRRFDLIASQIAAVGKAIDTYISMLVGKVKEQMRAEIEYRYSDEFAKEEAEAHEHLFTENGALIEDF